MRFLLTGLLLCTTITGWADDFSSVVQPFLEKHCVSCHGETKSKGGIVLHDLTDVSTAFEKHELLENIIDQVRHEDMPPDDEDVLPSDAERAEFLAPLEDILEKIKKGDVPQSAGRVVLRRLNRNEYHYTVKDLFGVKFNPARGFPADGAGGEGFDTLADALFSTPSLLEKYLQAATQVVDSVYESPASLRKVIIAKPGGALDANAAAEKVLTFHATRAYRRRVSTEDVAPLLGVFKRGQQDGLNYQESLRAPLTAILVNPRFLFRAEAEQPGKTEWPLTDFELATRLSYFLWSSMPDSELFRLADKGELSDPKVLEAQVDRMLKSPKARALSRHFAGQWIGFDAMVNEVNPDAKRFPEFDQDLRRSMYYEATQFFSHLVKQDRPITDLIDSDYAFVNERLAKHYGMNVGVKGSKLKKVKLSDKNRGGVLGMGAVLTSTSLPMRTSPVLRGVWILDSLLGDPAPPPPPDAGELPADDTMAGGLTFREQLEIHRTAKSCAGCHARIDPLGFSLENFDAIGRWREKDANGKALDTQAILPGDVEFSSPSELKGLLMFGKEKFARNMCRKMLSYSLGRPLEYYDEAVLTDLVNQLKSNDFKTQSLIKSVVLSKPFTHRSAKR